MDLDAKQKVLLAIYTEYQKDVPDMSLVTSENLGMDARVFRIALDKLQNEGLIRGAMIHFSAGKQYPDKAVATFVKMTREGLSFIEERMGIEHTCTGREKVQQLEAKFGKYGWDALIDFAAKTLAEIAKQAI